MNHYTNFIFSFFFLSIFDTPHSHLPFIVLNVLRKYPSTNLITFQKESPVLIRCRPASTKHNSRVPYGRPVDIYLSKHFYPSHTQKTAPHYGVPFSFYYGYLFILSQQHRLAYGYTIIPARIILAMIPASVDSSAPLRVYLVFVTFAARK